MADKRAEGYGQDPSTQNVVDLLTSILDEFKKQAQTRTPPPLTGSAATAVAAFKEISEALDVKPAKTGTPTKTQSTK